MFYLRFTEQNTLLTNFEDFLLINNQWGTHMKILSSFLLGLTILVSLSLQAMNHEQQEELNQQLFEAVKKDDLSNVTALLQAGADVNTEDENGSSPLHYAAYKGHANVVALLLTHGAYIDKVTNNGTTSLHFAVDYGHADVVILLISHGASINKANHLGETPFHYAVDQGYANIVTLLLKHGAQIDESDKCGQTPLHLAIDYGHVDVVTLLLNHGAQVDKGDTHDYTPLHYAVCDGHVDVVTLLLKHGASVNEGDDEGWIPLHWAAHKGYTNIALVLLNHSDQPDKTDILGQTPLHLAAKYDYTTTAHLLKIFSTLSMQAFRTNPTRYLEEHPLDERTLDATPLHFAVLCNKPAIVKALLKRELAILDGDDRKHSPLLYALWFSHTAIAQELINALAQQRGGNLLGALTLGDTKDRCALSYIAQHHYRFLNYLITQHQLLVSKND
jgi:ankyrin repeat protein